MSGLGFRFCLGSLTFPATVLRGDLLTGNDPMVYWGSASFVVVYAGMFEV